VGRRLQDLEVSYRPVELRSLIDRALTERRTVQIDGVESGMTADGPRYLDVVVTPLGEADGDSLGVAVSFNDVSAYNRLQSELTRSRQELETAYEELQSTNEELETTNEELQSTVEELETTNEELQSANEELETMNEELQSTNSELQSINTELHRRSSEVDRLNSFIETVMATLGIGVAVLDTELRVMVWNERSVDLWGLRDWEVTGQSFVKLDIGLPVADLVAQIRRCLGGEKDDSEHVVDAMTRRGRTIRCRVTCRPVVGARGAIEGVVVMMEEVREPAPAHPA
jgi:two-component system CheB/CheR fusion protein